MPELQAVYDTRQAQANQDKFIASFRVLAAEAAKTGRVLDGAFGGNVDGIKKTADATKNLGTESRTAGVFLGQLRTLIPTIAAGAVVAKVVSLAQAFEGVQKAVATVVPTSAQAAAVTGQLADIAASAGLSLTGTAQTFQQFSIATQDLNLSQAETIGLVDTLSRGLSLFATSTSAASAAQLQLGQAFASGRLQGDEFRSVAENFPPLVTAIAEVLGVARAEVKGFGADGLITSEVLVQAFGVLEKQLDGLGGTIERTTSQAIAGLTVRLTEFAGKADDALGISSKFTAFLDDLASDINIIGDELFPELNKQIEESGAELENLAQAVEDAGGEFDQFGDANARAGNAVQAYNEQLFEHRELLAEAAAEAAKAAIAAGDTGNALNSAGINFAAFADAATDAQQGLTGFRREAADAAKAAALVALANQDLGDSAFSAGINYKTLNDETIAATLNSERAAAAAKEEAEARRQATIRAREEAESLRDFNRAFDEQIDLFRAAAKARRDAGLDDFNRDLERQAELFDLIKERQEETFRGIADSLGDLVGTSGAAIDGFFDNFSGLLNKLGFEVNASFENIAAVIAETFGTSIEQLDGFFGLAVEGLDILGIEFEDLFGKKLTGVIERFAGLSSNEINALGGIFGQVAGVIGGIFNPQVDASTQAFNALGFAGNESLGGISTQVEGLINDVFGLNQAIDGTTASTPALGGALAAVFTVGSIGFADLKEKVGGVQAALLGGLNPSILTTNGLFKIFGIDAVGAVQSVIGSFGDLGGAVLQFGGLFSGVVGQATSIFKLFTGDIQGALLGALGPMGSALSAFGVNFNGVINGARNAATAGFNAIRNVATGAFNAIAGAARNLAGAVSGAFNTIVGGARSAFGAVANIAQGAFNAVANAARAAAGAAISALQGITGAVGNIAKSITGQIGSAVGKAKDLIGGIPGIPGLGGGAGKIFSGAKKVFKKLFAEGGVITGPTSLAGPGVGGKAFRSGGVLDFPTVLGNPENVTGTRQLGIAGEAGPEAILPLTQTSDGLGVTAKVGGNSTVVKVIFIEGVDRAETDRIKREIASLNASVESRAAGAALDILSEAA